MSNLTVYMIEAGVVYKTNNKTAHTRARKLCSNPWQKSGERLVPRKKQK